MKKLHYIRELSDCRNYERQKKRRHLLKARVLACATAPLPQSIHWLYGFGFKIGFLLLLRAAVTLRYLWTNLSFGGAITLLMYGFLSAILIAGGLIMQDQTVTSSAKKMCRVRNLYFFTTVLLLAITNMRSTFGWQYFKNPRAVNWFVDFFNKIFGGLKELGLSLFFIDIDLQIIFCLLLGIVAWIYGGVHYGIWSRYPTALDSEEQISYSKAS